jgi:hypothetical protein
MKEWASIQTPRQWSYHPHSPFFLTVKKVYISIVRTDVGARKTQLSITSTVSRIMKFFSFESVYPVC